MKETTGDTAGMGWPARRSVAVSVLIPAKEEARNIAACVRSCAWAEQVVVVDSGSRDETAALAAAEGAEAVRFDYAAQTGGWPKKKNWALEHVAWRHAWVLVVDADERATPALAWEIAGIVGTAENAGDPRGDVAGFYLNRRFLFMGRWIRHCGYYPSWNLRLFRHALGRYERIGNLGDTGTGDNEVHEHVTLRGKTGFLREELIHEAYPDLTTWIEKHNRYSTWEAMVMEAGRTGAVATGPAAARRRFRRLADRLPFRPTLRFLYGYVFRLGFLDGYPGFVLCRMMAWYEFASSAKLHERRMRRDTPGPRDADAPSIAAPASHAPMAASAHGGETPASTYTAREKIGRLAWSVVEATLFRLSFRTMHGWRAALLRAFGATVGRGCRISRAVRVECPWNLTLGEGCVIGDRAILYCLGPVRIGDHVTISQLAHLCAGTHDYTKIEMPLIRSPITVGAHAWIAADAFVGPGVTIGDRAILGARASAFSNLPAGFVAIGNPARPVKPRAGSTPAPAG